MASDPETHDAALAQDAGLVARVPEASELAVSLLSAIPDCVKLLDLEGRLSSMSHAGLCLMEIDDFPSLQGRPWWDLWPAEAEDTLRRSVLAAGQGRAGRFTAFCPTAKGTPKWWDVTVAPLRDAEGAVSGIVSLSRDVTGHIESQQQIEARRADVEAALEHTRLLLREIDHRVKNSLMLIVGLLEMQIRNVGNPAAAEALAEAAQRVRTVARVHDRLYRADAPDRVALDDYLQPLCADLETAFRDGEGGIVTELVPLWVPPDRAVALGLITAELVANAFRHAGMSPEGRVTVSLATDGEDRMRLVVADEGRGLPHDFSPGATRGVGMRVVLGKADEIDGSLTWANRPTGGAAFTLHFPSR